MNLRIRSLMLAIIFWLAVSPSALRGAQGPAPEDDGPAVLGSIALSLLHFPVKLVTCAATQATAAVAYVATFGVAGNHEGGTNGKKIGEVARKSCTGSWLITPEQVKQDYYP